MKSSRKNQKLELARKLIDVILGRSGEIVLNDLLFQNLRQATLSEKMHWLEQILRWLFRGGSTQVDTRFRYFFRVLEQNPDCKTQLRLTVGDVLRECSFLSFFTYVGLAVEHGLWGDIAGRVTAKITPRGGRTDFQEILRSGFESVEARRNLELLPDEVLRQISALIFDSQNESAWLQLRSQLREAVLFLATHVAHYGISTEIRGRLQTKDHGEISNLAFLKLARVANDFDPDLVGKAVEDCFANVKTVYDRMEDGGVSVDVVNRLETISALLERIQQILKVETALPGDPFLREARGLTADAVDASLRGRSVVGYVRRHFYLLSRKIVERNGLSGEHYIARGPSERRVLFRSAIAGGWIVVVMTILKTILIHTGPPPLFLAVGIWVIYAAGFLSMQFLGCTLATKIPSVTASRLAGLLREIRKLDLLALRNELILVFQSQGIALIGNLVGVIPLAFLMNFIFQRTFGSSGLMDEHYAWHTLHDLNPILSFAVPLGALTGVQLWMSSVAGGWFENWIVFNRVPAAIENHHRLKKVIGDASAKRLAGWVLHQSSGIATNLALGFLFGFVPMLGLLFGLNWNGNHVTISTASSVFALSSLHFEVGWLDLAGAACGLFFIAVMNFGVSFGLALFIAGNAQHMKFRRVLFYLRKCLRKPVLPASNGSRA